MRGYPQPGEAGIIDLWNSKNFSSSENSRLPITPSVFNPSNEAVINGNKNGNECVHRRAQNDLPLRAIILKRGGILDCRIFNRGTQISFNDHKSFSHLDALLSLSLSLSRSSSFRSRIVFDYVIVMAVTKGKMWGMVR
jgi:hypothetical protein